MLKENFECIEKKIQESCNVVDRLRKEVTLIAVSKTKPVSLIEEAYEQGLRDFGENKVQEILEKYDVLPKDIRWHMIGHLQRNKVRQIIDKVVLIHSVDSYRLAEEINIQAKKKNKVMDILLEVNLGKEATKFGIYEEDLLPLINDISKLENVKIKGLMTVAPNVSDPEENRPIFEKLRELSVDIKEKNIDNVSMVCLSMGMSNDYTIAIEEGSTMVRLGTCLFGERNYNK